MVLKLKNGPQCLVQQKRYNIHLVKDEETSRKFAPEVRNRYQVLGDQQEPDGEPTIEDKWCQKKDSYHAASETILGVKRKHHKDSINLRTLEHINRRRELKGKINQTRSERQRNRMRIEYSELSRKALEKIRRQFMEELAETAEIATSKNEMRTIYKITQQICGYKNP